MIGYLFAVLFICCLSACVSSFRLFNYNSVIRNSIIQLHSNSVVTTSDLDSSATNPVSRLLLTLEGPNVNNAIFRAELKKELTFFRGCDAEFLQISDTKAEVVAEGKTIQLGIQRFLRWLKVFGTSLRERKPNFQGPSLVVYIIDLKWSEYVGNIKGFTATTATTVSSQADKEISEDGIEVSAMMGTDESV